MVKTGRMKMDVGRAALKGKHLTARQKKIRDNMQRVYKRKDGVMTIEAPGYGAISIMWRDDIWKGEYIQRKGDILGLRH